MQGHDRVHAEAAATVAECQEQDGTQEDRIHNITEYGLWRLVDHLHVGSQHGSVDLQGSHDRIFKYTGAAKEGHQVRGGERDNEGWKHEWNDELHETMSCHLFRSS